MKKYIAIAISSILLMGCSSSGSSGGNAPEASIPDNELPVVDGEWGIMPPPDNDLPIVDGDWDNPICIQCDNPNVKWEVQVVADNYVIISEINGEAMYQISYVEGSERNSVQIKGPDGNIIEVPDVKWGNGAAAVPMRDKVRSLSKEQRQNIRQAIKTRRNG